MKKKEPIIYDIFRTKTIGGKDVLNEIVKGTKSVLASKNGYKHYTRSYFLRTKISTFKSPDITEYPLLKKDSSILIPITQEKFKENVEKKLPKKRSLLLESEVFKKNNINFLEDFNRRLNRILKFNEEVKNSRTFSNKFFTKTNERYNSLFLDFFNKWKSYNKGITNYLALSEDKKYEAKNKSNNNGISFTNFNMKERYSGLHYDEKEIFDTNYDKFIFNKIKYVKTNKIKNFTSEMKSTFHDANERKIKLKLESIKLTFNPKNKGQNVYSEFYIFIPLSYVFLFYYSDFSFFQKVLMSLLKFDKDFKTINFKDDGFIELLNKLKIGNQEESKEADDDVLSNNRKDKSSIKRELSNSPNENDISDMRKTYSRNTNFGNKLLRKPTNFYANAIKTKVIHSNKKLNRIIKEKDTNKKNNQNILYNEYFFIWETSAVTFEVKMEMPRIYFSYQNINYNTYAFCDKNLFLYLYKNNFVNWDFYALNYLFSFKYFRKIVLNFFSLTKRTNIFENDIFPNMKEVKTPNIVNKLKYNIEEENNSEDEFEENKDIIICNKKVLNQMSENNESYMFFYSDQNYNNYIINLFSYKIKIEYQKLNPKLNWEFLLNFKQMRNLNEVSQYEDLLTFLPKIIITNFEIGELDINFEIFQNNFDAKILQNQEEHNPDKKKQLKIEIFKPYIESEKIGGRDEKKLEKELNFNLLQDLNGLKMASWSRKILGIMKKDLFYKSHRATDIYTNKLQFMKKGPQKEDIITKPIIKKNNKKKLTFYSGFDKMNINNND